MRYLIAIVLFGLLILIHELAHVVAARLFGIRVERLVLGFGPAFYSIRRGGTELALGAIPLGAHATILGMNPHTEALEKAGRSSYSSRGPWIRLLVLLSGSFANYVLALAMLVILHMLGTHVPVRMTVGTVEPGSASAKAGIHPGDVVLAINGTPEKHWSRIVDNVADAQGAPLVLRIQRGDETLEIEVKPRPDARGDYRIGIAQQYVFRQHVRFADSLRLAVTHGNAVIREGTRVVFRLLQGKTAANPLVLLRQSSEGASSGARGWLRLAVALSLALMAFNLLPLPSFDGGRALLVVVELVSKRRLAPAREAWLHTLGFWFLIVAILWLALANVRKVLPRSAASRAEKPAAVAPPDEAPSPAAFQAPDVEGPGAVPGSDGGVLQAP